MNANHLIFIPYNENGLYGYGKNDNYQLGIGNKIDQAELIKIENTTRFKKVCTSATYSVAIDIDGNLWGAGYNDKYALNSDRSIIYKWKIIDSSRTWIDVQCNNYGIYLLDNNENMYVRGYNGVNEYILGITDNYAYDLKLSTTKVKSIEVFDNGVIIKKNEAFYVSGYKNLGNGNGLRSVRFLRIGGSYSNSNSYANYDKIIIAKSFGSGIVCLNNENQLIIFGETFNGQLNNLFNLVSNEQNKTIKSVHTKGRSCICICNDGSLLVFGNSGDGTLFVSDSNVNINSMYLNSDIKIKHISFLSTANVVSDNYGNLYFSGKYINNDNSKTLKPINNSKQCRILFDSIDNKKITFLLKNKKHELFFDNTHKVEHYRCKHFVFKLKLKKVKVI